MHADAESSELGSLDWLRRSICRPLKTAFIHHSDEHPDAIFLLKVPDKIFTSILPQLLHNQGR